MRGAKQETRRVCHPAQMSPPTVHVLTTCQEGETAYNPENQVHTTKESHEYCLPNDHAFSGGAQAPSAATRGSAARSRPHGSESA